LENDATLITLHKTTWIDNQHDGKRRNLNCVVPIRRIEILTQHRSLRFATRKKIFMETSPELLSHEKLLAMRDGMLGQMAFSRDYTLNLIANVPDELWQKPSQRVPSHFAWQIGHLAVAQYGLMLFRQRGRAEGDLDLMPGWLRKRYARGSVPSVEESPEATKSEMLELLAKIHTAAMAFVPTMSAESLAEPTDMPYTAYPIKLGALLFCPLHESIHAGQIGLLRRAHGLDPVR
jgi:hypothetical protein